jgi:hypothetical protein
VNDITHCNSRISSLVTIAAEKRYSLHNNEQSAQKIRFSVYKFTVQGVCALEIGCVVGQLLLVGGMIDVNLIRCSRGVRFRDVSENERNT